jgi:hypothetical protein
MIDPSRRSFLAAAAGVVIAGPLAASVADKRPPQFFGEAVRALGPIVVYRPSRKTYQLDHTFKVLSIQQAVTRFDNNYMSIGRPEISVSWVTEKDNIAVAHKVLTAMGARDDQKEPENLVIVYGGHAFDGLKVLPRPTEYPGKVIHDLLTPELKIQEGGDIVTLRLGTLFDASSCFRVYK